MKALQRVGAGMVAAGFLLFGNAVAAQAAPAGDVAVTVDRLVLAPADSGHAGSVRIVVKNRTNKPFSGGITITEPIRNTFDQFTGANGCVLGKTPDQRSISFCGLENEIAPRSSGVVTVSFRSPAKPEAYPQIAPASGSVQVADATADFAAVFRSTTGSVRDPRPYVQDTASKLAVTTASNVTLTRQADGTFAGRIAVDVRNNGDAPQRGLGAVLVTPAGINPFPDIVPSQPCGGGGNSLPVPPGGDSVGCSVAGGQLAEGAERVFEWVLTAPAETQPGSLGTATTLVNLQEGPTQTDNANVASFSVTVAG